jgi:hypothetical protein
LTAVVLSWPTVCFIVACVAVVAGFVLGFFFALSIIPPPDI